MIRKYGSVFATASRYCSGVVRRTNPSVELTGLASRAMSSHDASLVVSRSYLHLPSSWTQCSSSQTNVTRDGIATTRIRPSVRCDLNVDRPMSLPLSYLLGLSSRRKIPCMNAIHLQRSGYSTRIRQFSSSGKEKGGASGATGGTNASPSSSKLTSAIVQKLPEWHSISDAVSVYGIALLFLAVLLTPIVIEQMKHSDSTYEEVEVDDAVRNAVSDIAKDIEGTDIDRAFGIERKPRSLSEEEEDESTAVGNTINVVSDVLNSEALQSAIASLVTRVVQSSQFQNACQTLLKNLWNDLVNDPETTAQIVQLLNNAIKNDEIKRSVRELVLQLIQDEEVYRQFTNLVVRLGEDQEVLGATQALLTESAHKALNDPEILDHSMEFATDVVGDDIVQRTSGEALRNTVSYAVQPGLSTVLAFAGIALVFVSFQALGNVRASTREDAVIDAALSSHAFQVEPGERFLDRVTNLLLMPGTVIMSAGRAAVSVALLPFTVAGNAVSTVVRTGKSASSAVVNFPATTFHRLVDYVGTYTKPLASTYKRTGNAISLSIVGSAVRSLYSRAIQIPSLCSAAMTKVRQLPKLTIKVEDAIKQLSAESLATITQYLTRLARSSHSAIQLSHNASKRIGERLVATAGVIVSKTGAWSSHAILSLAACLSWLRGFVWGSRSGRV